MRRSSFNHFPSHRKVPNSAPHVVEPYYARHVARTSYCIELMPTASADDYHSRQLQGLGRSKIHHAPMVSKYKAETGAPSRAHAPCRYMKGVRVGLGVICTMSACCYLPQIPRLRRLERSLPSSLILGGLQLAFPSRRIIQIAKRRLALSFRRTRLGNHFMNAAQPSRLLSCLFSSCTSLSPC